VGSGTVAQLRKLLEIGLSPGTVSFLKALQNPVLQGLGAGANPDAFKLLLVFNVEARQGIE
jgi:hypothetical protein